MYQMKRKVIVGIYQIKNLRNNKVYIGQSKNIYSRWTDHRKSAGMSWKYV